MGGGAQSTSRHLPGGSDTENIVRIVEPGISRINNTEMLPLN